VSEFYYNKSGRISGPFSIDELRYLVTRGKVKADALIRHGTDGHWKPADEVAGLIASKEPRSPAPNPILTQSVATINSTTEDDAVVSPPCHALVGPVPPPISRKSDRRPQLIGFGIGTTLALLILLLFLLFSNLDSGGAGLAGRGMGNGGTGGGSGNGGTGGGSGNGGNNEQGKNTSHSEANGNLASLSGSLEENRNPNPANNEGKASNANKSQVGGSTKPVEITPKPGEFTIEKFVDDEDEGTPSQGGQAGETQAKGSDQERMLAGVKVKGSIALICDISGSMSQDFPPLVKELRQKFPKSTPLVLVEGCDFRPANPNAQPPQKITGGYFPVMLPLGTEYLLDDPHVFLADSTTDAIIYAVKMWKRRTVMFNNDLQDGGSERSIYDFEVLRKKFKFTLSGRSLNCDAPVRLRQFINKSGGEFKVDTIGRTKMQAVQWAP
jgi:GYF domain 2